MRVLTVCNLISEIRPLSKNNEKPLSAVFVNQRLIRKFPFPIDKGGGLCYTVSCKQIANSAKGGDRYDESLYLSDRLRAACRQPSVRPYISYAHPIQGVFFVRLKHISSPNPIPHPKGCFLFFEKSPRI